MEGADSPWWLAELGVSKTRLQTAGAHLVDRAWSEISTFEAARYRAAVRNLVAEARALPVGIWQRAERELPNLTGRREHLLAVLETEAGRLVRAVRARLPLASWDEVAHLRGQIGALEERVDGLIDLINQRAEPGPRAAAGSEG